MRNHGLLYLIAVSLTACATSQTAATPESHPSAVDQPRTQATLDGRPPLAVAEEFCNNGEWNACADLGMRYFNGTAGAPQDHARSIAYFTRGCDGGNGHCCFGLAAHYMNGLGVPQDAATSLTYLHKACTLGLDAACGLEPEMAEHLNQGSTTPYPDTTP